ncbi:hypothetical protein ISR94_00400 [Candidatus Microgenomates bacterium]|nr:hypothetical protein [Candidatus Microgenomates bacterium]
MVTDIMATKFKDYFNRMLESEKELFLEFEKMYDRYALDQNGLQAEFNIEGEKIMDVIRSWETKLCSQSEKAGFGGYTSKLSEKFMAEVRKKYPLIDFVGVISTSKPKPIKSNFSIKKIAL